MSETADQTVEQTATLPRPARPVKKWILAGAILLILGLGSAYYLVPARPKVQFLGNSTVVISYREMPGFPQRSVPTIEACVNGVKGNFLIDTGANMPILTGPGVRACGIDLSRMDTAVPDPSGSVIVAPMKMVENLTLEIKADDGSGAVTVKWSKALAHAADAAWLGIIDHDTLKRLNAVIDTKARTITISK